MYVNKCIKCGAEFETKNPKRVICPNCLYADKGESTEEKPMQSYSSYSSYSAEQKPRNYDRQQGGYRNNNGNYNRDNYGQRDYNRDNRNQGNYQRRDYNNNRNNGYSQQRRQDGQRDNRGGFRNNYASGGRNNGGFQQRRPAPNKHPRMQKPAKPLLVSKEQLEQIEVLYKTMLPLPNPDAHEIIGAKIGLEPQKVFFGINLVRQKMMLPKLPFPKRKLAISPDQLLAIKSLYEPLLPLPPIGCHKIIAAQLRMDEWRVHVGIKLVRAQLGLDRWNEDRADKPADYMVLKHEKVTEETPVQDSSAEVAPEVQTEEVVVEKPKRGRKPKKKADEE